MFIIAIGNNIIVISLIISILLHDIVVVSLCQQESAVSLSSSFGQNNVDLSRKFGSTVILQIPSNLKDQRRTSRYSTVQAIAPP